jgi:hypothetical protein
MFESSVDKMRLANATTQPITYNLSAMKPKIIRLIALHPDVIPMMTETALEAKISTAEVRLVGHTIHLHANSLWLESTPMVAPYAAIKL